MKKLTILVFFCACASLLTAQVRSTEAPTNSKTPTSEAPSSPASTVAGKKPLSEADQLDRDHLVKIFKEQGDAKYQEGKFHQAYRSYRKLQSLAPSPAIEEKLKACRKAMHPASQQME